MSLINVFKSYIKKMISECDPGYKIMLMDKYTTSSVSLVVGLNEIMRDEVYMFEQLENLSYGENMSYLKCIVFIRPTSDNIHILCEELRRPRYGTYFIYFSNSISKNEIKRLAESDENEVVQEIQEIYADFMAWSPHLFSFNSPYHSIGQKWIPDSLKICSQGISSILVSLQHVPTIRFQNNSELCQLLAENVRADLQREGFLDSENDHQECLLLILDRKDDPVTPLLHQWTYEAMVTELLGIKNGRVNLSHVQGISKELEEVVMIPSQDEFYAKSMYLNYGDIGQTIKELMEEYQRKLSKQQKVESLADMKHFVENYPQFKKMSGTVSKHVTVLGELSRLVQTYQLLELSECEQELVCGFEHSKNLQHVKELITSAKTREKDAVKLVMLYALRYEKEPNNDLKNLIALLRKKSVSDHSLKALQNLMDYSGFSERQSSLFEKAIPQDVSSIHRRLFKGIKGVDNIYTQHTPLVSETINLALKARLKESSYPFCGRNNSVRSPQGADTAPKPQVIIAFIVGGVTSEEAYAVHQLNSSTPNVKIYLGGNHVHSSQSFLDSVEHCGRGLTRRALRL